MREYTINEVRKKFLEYFAQKAHLVVPSFSLVPQNDPSLLLINAGMAPLKPYFLGTQVPPSTKMATCQKCIRTGDIENVGITDRHGTFFEMLGNFSFGDYFKKEAIQLAWDFMTQALGLSEDVLWVSVYEEDQEAFDLWAQTIGIPPHKIVRMGKEDNFWEHGLGPCGPCSEIYIDRGAHRGCGHKDCKPGCDCDRFVEVWNLVFSQYDKQEDGTYLPLPSPNIDTGMGLERLVVVLNDANNIFEISPIVDILNGVVSVSHCQYKQNKHTDISIRLITDHIRTMVFMIGDNILPSNEGRGYVLRRIIRRAYRHGKNLGIEGSFLHTLSPLVIRAFEEAYPELLAKEEQIKEVILREEMKFQETLESGMNMLQSYVDEMKAQNETVLSGGMVFKLYDTYGFPYELTEEILKEYGFSCDAGGFKKEMENQRIRAREARNESDNDGWTFDEKQFLISEDVLFQGYEQVESTTEIHSIYDTEGKGLSVLHPMQEGIVVLDHTPFYGESGGQVGDIGKIYVDKDNYGLVLDTKKTANQKIYHKILVKAGQLSVGQKVIAQIDADRREDIARNHTATHLLHKALKEILGEHVNQAGSLVESEKLRFDFNHYEGISETQRQDIEHRVNEMIFSALPVKTQIKKLEDAKKEGATALFGEKYTEDVRVVSMGDYSMELCGGTHVKNTSHIQMFKIVSETGIASGVRRIEAITGRKVYAFLLDHQQKMKDAAHILKTSAPNLVEKCEHLMSEQKEMQREIERLKAEINKNASKQLLSEMKEIGNLKYIAQKVKGMSPEQLRDLADNLKDKMQEGVVILFNEMPTQFGLLASATEDAVKKGVHCGKLIGQIAAVASGKGGGRPNMAQGAAPMVENLQKAMAQVPETLKQQIK